MERSAEKPLPDNFRDFAFCHDQKIADLAQLVSTVDEYWGLDNRYLSSYLRATYVRAAQVWNKADDVAACPEGLLFDDDKALFNTGLFTDSFEVVYLLFESNRKPDACQPWFLKGCFKESDRALDAFPSLPGRVHYGDEPADLIFDYRLEIRLNYDHILRDEENVKRLPERLRGEESFALLRSAFEGAVDVARRRAAANYTVAVPQFYNGRLQLLLPLCLIGEEPDLALAIERVNGHYAARTCLDMEMAYCNARVICRPEASWICRAGFTV